jgi:hypothetical protein
MYEVELAGAEEYSGTLTGGTTIALPRIGDEMVLEGRFYRVTHVVWQMIGKAIGDEEARARLWSPHDLTHATIVVEPSESIPEVYIGDRS